MVPTDLLTATAPVALWCIARYGITKDRSIKVRGALQQRRGAGA